MHQITSDKVRRTSQIRNEQSASKLVHQLLIRRGKRAQDRHHDAQHQLNISSAQLSSTILKITKLANSQTPKLSLSSSDCRPPSPSIIIPQKRIHCSSPKHQTDPMKSRDGKQEMRFVWRTKRKENDATRAGWDGFRIMEPLNPDNP